MATYEIIKNEEGVITQINVDGKPVAPMYMRGIKKAQVTSYWKEVTENAVGTNQFTGKEVQLNPLEATIFNFCMEWYKRYDESRGKNMEAPIQTYDDMKYFLLEINTNAYYDLLD